jgi:hypothetical protein
MKITSNGRKPQNIERRVSQQPLIGSSFKFETLAHGTKPKLRIAPNKDGQQSKTFKYLSQQPLIGYSSKFKLRLRGYRDIHLIGS